MKKNIIQNLGFFGLFLCMAATLACLGAIIYFIGVRGFKVISWEFLTQGPRLGMTQGGIAPAIVGTFYLTLGAILFALPLGIACAIYLCEYSPKGFVVNLIRISINNPKTIMAREPFGHLAAAGIFNTHKQYSFHSFTRTSR